MQRVRMSLPYYRANGWEPVVLAVGEPWVEGVREPALAQTVPPDVRVEWCPALSLKWSRRLGLGSLGPRSFFSLLRRGNRLLRAERFDLIFFSTTQFTVFSLGPIWRRWFGVHYVIDVQDPWRTDYYERRGSRRPPGGWKYQLARMEARLLEGRCYTRAAAVMSVSPAYLDDIRVRYPAFARIPTAVIRFGASDIDLAFAALVPGTAPFRREAGEIHLLYTGAAGPVMPHALNVLFDAVRLYRAQNLAGAERLRFHFVGTSYAAPDRAVPSVLPVAAAAGVLHQVSETAHRIGFLDAIRLQQQADILLVLGSSDLAYSPSKIYLYYLTQRPILGVVFEFSVMQKLLDELSCAYLVTFREHGPKEPAHAALHRFFDQILSGNVAATQPARDDAQFRAKYLAAELTRQQCELFERALAPPP
jgi:hypothetical protein